VELLKKKSKGMTLIELIIALSFTVVILGIVYTFFLTSNRNFTLVDLQTTLHSEGKAIEEKILKIGTEAKEIVSIENASGTEVNDGTINDLGLASDNTLDVSSLTFKAVDGTETKVVRDGKIIKLVTLGDNVLSGNVKSLKIKPLNINQIADSEKDTKLVKDLSSYEITILLEIEKGKVKTTHSVSVNVKFRNKEDLEAEVRTEAKNIEVNIVNKGSLSQGLKGITAKGSTDNIIETPLKTLGLVDDTDTLDIGSIVFKKYDNTDVTFSYEGTSLKMTVVKDGEVEVTTISECITEFKIKAINSEDIVDETTELNDLPGFELVGKVELEYGSIVVAYPIDIIVKFAK
jgi:Tfp pilus assembly protein PilE